MPICEHEPTEAALIAFRARLPRIDVSKSARMVTIDGQLVQAESLTQEELARAIDASDPDSIFDSLFFSPPVEVAKSADDSLEDAKTEEDKRNSVFNPMFNALFAGRR